MLHQTETGSYCKVHNLGKTASRFLFFRFLYAGIYCSNINMHFCLNFFIGKDESMIFPIKGNVELPGIDKPFF